MKVCVGPAPRGSAKAWIESTGQAVSALRQSAVTPDVLPLAALDEVETFLETWRSTTERSGQVFRWQADVDPDQIEYVTYALYNLDGRRSELAARDGVDTVPAEGKTFHVVLVLALLHALCEERPSLAAFCEHLRETWPDIGLAA